MRDRVGRLDGSLFGHIRSCGTSPNDRRSLLALHAVLAERGDFTYLEIGSYLGASLQAFAADPRCTHIVSIDRRDDISPDERERPSEYADNTAANMLAKLELVPGADLSKLTTIDASSEDLDPGDFEANLCFIDGEHTNTAALRDARFCMRVIRGRGVIAFHDRKLVSRGILSFLDETSDWRAYPLAHDLFVVEVGVASLLDDERVKAQVPRKSWLLADRLHVVKPLLRLSR